MNHRNTDSKISSRERSTGRGSFSPAFAGPAPASSPAATAARVRSTRSFSLVVSTMMSTLTSIKAATTRKMGVKDWPEA